MPSVNLGTAQQVPTSATLSISPNPATYGQSVTITATCTPSTDACAIDYPTLGTAIATGTGSVTYTYNVFSLAAGTYSSFYANDITTAVNSIGQSLTVNKATPTLSLPNFPTNYTYNGNPATITANIITHNNQLTGNLYLSSTLVASTNTQTTYTTAATAGTYTFTFNTLGNTNYTAASVSNTLKITQNSTYTLAWLKKGTNQTWSNVPINTTAQIITHNNQLTASLYLNNGFITTTTTKTTQLNKIGFYHYVFNDTGNTNYTAKSINYTFWADVPISIENISAIGTVLTKSINYTKSPFTFNTYYPIKIYTSSPSNTLNYTLNYTLSAINSPPVNTLSTPGGISDGSSTAGGQGGNGMLMQYTYTTPPVSITGTINYTYSKNTILTANVLNCYNMVVYPNVVLTTNGYEIICQNNFLNFGSIYTGQTNNRGDGSSGGSYPQSYGGSGGGGGWNIPSGGAGYNGGSTTAPAGLGSTSSSSPGGSGSTPASPTLTQTLVNQIGTNSLIDLSGGGGGGSGYTTGHNGANGTYGVYIQAANVIYGYIHSNTTAPQNGGGGGGAGSILISGKYISPNIVSPVYGSSYISINALNISYVPPSNLIPGNYIYSILERQSNDSQTLKFTIATNTINMTDINSAFNFSTPLQYFPILAHTPTWTAKPTSWYIQSSNSVPQITQNTSAGAVFSTNVSGAFTPQIHLVYPFTSFVLNITDNPKVQNSITIQPFQFVIANSISSSLRNIANLSIYNQETFNSVIGANATFNISTTFNNYIFSAITQNNTDTNGKYFLEILKSNYQNPNITFQLNGTIAKPLFFAPSQLFCPTTSSMGSAANYNIGLVDTNGTKYSFYVYSSTGSSASGYILFINELQGVSARSAESLVVPASLPMAVPLEQTGQEYQYIIYSPNCKNVYYKGSFVDPTNPTYLTLTTGPNQAVFYNTTSVTGACALNTSVNPYKLLCAASDKSSEVYKYVLMVYNETNVLGSTSLVKQVIFNTSAFSYNTTLPKNSTYSYALYAYAFKSAEATITVNGGSLDFSQITLTAPLLGIFAFVLLLTLIFVGLNTGKPIILLLLVDIGLIAISMVGFVQIPSSVAIAFIFIGIVISFWSIKVR
jgi:hypothetical protein